MWKTSCVRESASTSLDRKRPLPQTRIRISPPPCRSFYETARICQSSRLHRLPACITIDDVIVVEDFRKSYGSVRAVNGISFAVHRGEIFGLLGPNGAGKTTTLECLEGLRSADAGTLRIMDIDPQREAGKLRNIVGVQLQSSALPKHVTVRESLQFFCAYHGVEPRYELLDRFDLAEKSGAQYYSLSAGQQRRLALALAIAHDPDVVFLDEPTAGLDVASRRELHAALTEEQESGRTIILSTHDMAEAETLCTRVAILLKGAIVSIGTPEELTATGSGYTKVSVRTTDSVLLGSEYLPPGAVSRSAKEPYLVCFTGDTAATVAHILMRIAETNDTLLDLRVERPSLEERFLELTGESAGGDAT